jgi:hypothetical protein
MRLWNTLSHASLAAALTPSCGGLSRHLGLPNMKDMKDASSPAGSPRYGGDSPRLKHQFESNSRLTKQAK